VEGSGEEEEGRSGGEEESGSGSEGEGSGGGGGKEDGEDGCSSAAPAAPRAATAAPGPAAGGDAAEVPLECEVAAEIVMTLIKDTFKKMNNAGLSAAHCTGALRLILDAVRTEVGE